MLLPAAIAVIMWSLGLTLTREEFRRVLTSLREVAIGMERRRRSPGWTKAICPRVRRASLIRLARLDNRQSTAIALELGIHNSALAIAVGATLSDEVAIPAADYGTFMLFAAGLLAWAMSRGNTVVP